MTTAEEKLDRLLRLLPQVVQDSDAFAGRPLQALLRVLGEQLTVVEDDITGLYENWFVETCDEWVLPYIGELVGVRPLPAAGRGVWPTPAPCTRGGSTPGRSRTGGGRARHFCSRNWPATWPGGRRGWSSSGT
jgi:hypothetical protein